MAQKHKEALKKSFETALPALYKKFVGLKEIIDILKDDDPDSFEVVVKLFDIINENAEIINRRKELIDDNEKLAVKNELLTGKLDTNLDEEYKLIEAYLVENTIKEIAPINKLIEDFEKEIISTKDNLLGKLTKASLKIHVSKDKRKELNRIKEETNETALKVNDEFDDIIKMIKEKNESLIKEIPSIDYSKMNLLREDIKKHVQEIEDNKKLINDNNVEIKKLDDLVKEKQQLVQEAIKNFRIKTYNKALEEIADKTNSLKQ